MDCWNLIRIRSQEVREFIKLFIGVMSGIASLCCVYIGAARISTWDQVYPWIGSYVSLLIAGSLFYWRSRQQVASLERSRNDTESRNEAEVARLTAIVQKHQPAAWARELPVADKD